MASSGADGTIRVWDPANPTGTLATLRANGGVSGTLAFAGDGEIVSVDRDGTSARVWSSGLAQPVAQLGNAQTESASLSPDGHLAIAGDQTVGLAVFNPRTGRAQEELPGSRGVAPVGGGFAPIDAGLADNGRLRVTTAHRQASSCGARATVPRLGPPPWRDRGRRLCGRLPLPGRIAVAWRDGEIEILAPLTGVSHTLKIAGAGTGVLTPDGSTLAVASGREVRVIDLASGRARRLIAPGDVAIGMLAFSDDGGQLAVGGAHFLDVYSLAHGPVAVRSISLPPAALTSLGLSRDGTLVTAGFNDQRASVWRVADGGSGGDRSRAAASKMLPSYIGDVQISPNDGFLLYERASARHQHLADF